MDEIIEFAYEASLEGPIDIQLADCIGYFNNKELKVRNHNKEDGTYQWDGCGAGKHSLGILHNGNILGCTSVRDASFIEGNIREISLKQIWEDPDKFSWNRNLTKEQLSGLCRKCAFGRRCLGGCANTRLTLGGSIHSENKYCSYHLAISKATAQFAGFADQTGLLDKAQKFAENNHFQLAELLLTKLLEFNPDEFEALKLYGYVSFMLENYSQAKDANERALEQNPNDAYANKGLGLSLARLGEIDQGIVYLKQAITLADESFMEPYFDLAVLLHENGREAEAISILEAGRSRSAGFVATSREFYEFLTMKSPKS